MSIPILFSIDVEAPVGKNGVNNLIFGKINEKEYGINHIMNMLDEYGIKGLFFVDFAEAWEYGKEAIKTVVSCIIDRGHFVGVHLHPDRMNKTGKRFLWEYSYSEQESMINKCTDLFVEMTGNKPVSFRAGRYGANNDTIDILAKLGYRIDMSMYYGMKKRCHINGDYETINAIKSCNGIIECPVTVYRSFNMFGYTRFDKIDESLPFGEFKTILKRIKKKNNVSLINFFMHSFSMLNWRKKPDSPAFSLKNEKRIRKMIEYMISEGFAFVNERDVEKPCISNRLINDTVLSNAWGLASTLYSLKRAFKIIKEKNTRNI